MDQYAVVAADRVPLTGAVDGTPWSDANAASIDAFPWYEGGKRQATTVRALYDDEAVYLQYHCEDEHSYAETTELNGEVWTDSCVEFFASPHPEERPHYFNFEVNCVGTFLLGWGPTREDRRRIPPDLAESIRVETSIPGPTTDGVPDDEKWWLAAALPFDTLSSFADAPVGPDAGTEWRGNFHRLGGRIDPQYAAWSAYESSEPDFHRPGEFGRVVFV